MTIPQNRMAMIPAAGKEQHNVETEAHLHMYVHMYVCTTMYFTAVVLDKVRMLHFSLHATYM